MHNNLYNLQISLNFFLCKNLSVDVIKNDAISIIFIIFIHLPSKAVFFLKGLKYATFRTEIHLYPVQLIFSFTKYFEWKTNLFLSLSLNPTRYDTIYLVTLKLISFNTLYSGSRNNYCYRDFFAKTKTWIISPLYWPMLKKNDWTIYFQLYVCAKKKKKHLILCKYFPQGGQCPRWFE